MRRILFLDDQPGFAGVMGTMLGDEGFEVNAYTSSRAALAALEVRAFDLIISDLGLPELGGTNLIEQLRSLAGNTPILVTSGFYFPEMLEELLVAGATDALAKPFRFPELAQKVREMIGNRPRSSETPDPALGSQSSASSES